MKITPKNIQVNQNKPKFGAKILINRGLEITRPQDLPTILGALAKMRFIGTHEDIISISLNKNHAEAILHPKDSIRSNVYVQIGNETSDFIKQAADTFKKELPAPDVLEYPQEFAEKYNLSFVKKGSNIIAETSNPDESIHFFNPKNISGNDKYETAQQWESSIFCNKN